MIKKFLLLFIIIIPVYAAGHVVIDTLTIVKNGVETTANVVKISHKKGGLRSSSSSKLYVEFYVNNIKYKDVYTYGGGANYNSVEILYDKNNPSNSIPAVQVVDYTIGPILMIVIIYGIGITAYVMLKKMRT